VNAKKKWLKKASRKSDYFYMLNNKKKKPTKELISNDFRKCTGTRQDKYHLHGIKKVHVSNASTNTTFVLPVPV